LGHDEVIRERRGRGEKYSSIARETGLSEDQVRRRWKKMQDDESWSAHLALMAEKYQAGAVGSAPTETRDLTFELPVRPVEVKLGPLPPNRLKPTGGFTSVHYSDTHYPYQDDRALNILYQVLHDIQPDLIVDHGDLLDCTSISRWEKDPRNRVTLQDEIQMAAEHMARVRSIVPSAKCWFIEGNHEDRVRRLIWDLASDSKTRELLQMPGVMENLELPALLGCERLGWKYHGGKVVLFEKLILKHGNAVRKWSGATAKEEWLRYGKSGMSGHTHRRAAFEHRDWNGVHAWWELGCMCDVDPSYMEDPDWQQGFVVATWSEDRRTFGVEEVRIHEGTAIFRGRVYRSENE
jgi:predicted phosphodiesterase